jgi:hypothetical protein
MPHSLNLGKPRVLTGGAGVNPAQFDYQNTSATPAPLLLVGAVGGFRGANMDHGGLVRVDALPAVEMIKADLPPALPASGARHRPHGL